jgi:hypothetical protein
LERPGRSTTTTTTRSAWWLVGNRSQLGAGGYPADSIEPLYVACVRRGKSNGMHSSTSNLYRMRSPHEVLHPGA